jgi:hypothetical protein
MNPVRLKFIVPPYVKVSLFDKEFRIYAMNCRDVDDSGNRDPRSYCLGIAEVGIIQDGGGTRFSLEDWESLKEAFNAWWRGFTVAQHTGSINALVSDQLRLDGSAELLSDEQIADVKHGAQESAKDIQESRGDPGPASRGTLTTLPSPSALR